ncbi:MAG: branched chain amino acid aminotransferase [Cytophagales bacterium CG12_big_fil_rev_8_21_14_0_65_40_12]|nr:MAG: branched chain amino acid aminotransferase [Cytophagales bacterium CG12_big_fil_rev_8_21_14_0_65_40_12]PIW03445.1 MAG: branched chain amino acid aminotransferase [Cytophagales bacterium CG17_big_fil_post_rev_8_21_14_2_50_40_13]
MIETMDISIEKVSQSRIDSLDVQNIPFGKLYSDHMFIADYKNGRWESPRIVPFQNISMSPANMTLHYAITIFEGMKAYKNEQGEVLLFRPEMNAKRLNISAERMCIPDVPESLFMEALTQLIDLDRNWVPNAPNTSLYIRPFVFSTDEYIGIRPAESFRFMIITCPVGAYYSAPVKVKIETKFSRAFEGGTGYAKTGGNYASGLYPAKLAKAKGFDQLVWTDGRSHEFIEESGTMNVMFVINDTLITSQTSGTILKGITRDSVLTLARDWGMKVEERNVSVKEVVEAAKNGTLQEAFGVGTAATIAHIAQIGHQDEVFELLPIENRIFSNRVLKTLDEIKTGQVEDKFGWTLKV